MTARIPVTLTVNGEEHALLVEPRRVLADAIREDIGLTGTHVGCQHGICGACTIILDGDPVRSCLVFAVQANGRAIRTVEGLSDGDALHPLQEAFMEHHGLQCGYCTPGFLMLAAAVLERDPHLDDAALLDLVSGNLCRCTGYDGILKSIRAAADRIAAEAASAPPSSCPGLSGASTPSPTAVGAHGCPGQAGA